MRLLWVFVSLFSLANSAKILFVSFTNSKSHIGSMLPMAQALSKRGHDVTMYGETYKPLGDFDGIKSHYVLLPQPKVDHFMLDFMDIVWNKEGEPEKMIFPHRLGNSALSGAVKEESFWIIANQTWDLIISDEVFTPTGYGLALSHAEKHGTPHAVFSTTDTLHVFTTMLSLNRNPALMPSYYTRHDEPLFWHVTSFTSRLNVVRYAIAEYVIIGIISEWLTRQAIDQIGYFGFTWSRYYETASIVYSDYPDRYAWPVANGNDLVFVGSYCITGSKALSQELEDFVSDPQSKGTIYVAFGSVVQWQFAPKRVVDAYVEALNNLTDYRVIWSYKGEPLAVKNHVRLMEWAPQIDLLNHPKTRIFISHAGLKRLFMYFAGIAILIMRISLSEPDRDLAMVMPISIVFLTDKPLLVSWIVLSIYRKWFKKESDEEKMDEKEKETKTDEHKMKEKDHLSTDTITVTLDDKDGKEEAAE